MDKTSLFLKILKIYWGYDTFRDMQLETIESVADGQDTLVLMPTGGGKSLLYQVPGIAMSGVCIVVTPLIALMKDQVDRLRARNISAYAIHTGVSSRDVDRILDNCVYGDVKFLYIAPERIDSEVFKARYGKMKISMIAVDEAHCISQWGYDFRPAYLRIARLREANQEVPVLALTASATPLVVQDIMNTLKFRTEKVIQVSFARKNLSYIVRKCEDKREQMLRIIRNVGGTGIVYVRTRDMTEILAEFLRENGINADAYHGGMGYFDRNLRQDRWTRSQTQVIVATNAFGMGIDKADVRYVVHYDICESLEAYYQEAGRAGRDGVDAYAVMLYNEEDLTKGSRRLKLDFPSIDVIKNIYASLFNYLQIAVGEGKMSTHTFNIYAFSAQFKIFRMTAYNALKILQQNGYLTLTDEMDNPSRIMFIVRRDDLYRIRVQREELDHFITLVLRQYSGVFSDFVSIDESALAHLSGYTMERVHEMLQQLWQLHIIKYIPGNRSPLLILHEERLPIESVRISPESHMMRREIAEQRLSGIMSYVQADSGCRSQIIQSYFGEKNVAECGKCDFCRENRKPMQKSVPDHIKKLLRESPREPKELVAHFRMEPDELLSVVREMLRCGEIIQEKSGKLRINR